MSPPSTLYFFNNALKISVLKFHISETFGVPVSVAPTFSVPQALWIVERYIMCRARNTISVEVPHLTFCAYNYNDSMLVCGLAL